MGSDAKTITVESSPTEILSSLTTAERKSWRETGVLPEPKPVAKEEKVVENKETRAEPSTAKIESTEEKKETPEQAAASATAAKEPKEEYKARTKARIESILADNKRLRDELAAAQKMKVVAPAKLEEVAKPHRHDVDEKTNLPKYASDEAFEAAYETYLTAKVTKDVETRTAKAQTEARQAEVNRINQQRWQNSLKLAVERHADFAKVLEADAKNMFQNAEIKAIKTNGVLDAFCLDSEIGAEILYYLASHKGEVARIEAMNAFAAARELTRLEDKLLVETADDTTVKEEGSSTEKKVSAAPAPASSIGGKATAPADEAEAALKAGDFRRYKKAADAEEHAKRKKG